MITPPEYSRFIGKKGGVLMLNPKRVRDLTPGLLSQAAQPILRATSSPRLFGRCSLEGGAQYTRTSGSSRLSASNTHLGASTSVPPVARQQVGWAHHIHPCRLYLVGRLYALPHFKLTGPGCYHNTSLGEHLCTTGRPLTGWIGAPHPPLRLYQVGRSGRSPSTLVPL